VWCPKSFLLQQMDDGNYSNVRKWSSKALKRSFGLTSLSIFDLWRIVLPVNITNTHWTSVHVDLRTKEILYYDSMGGPGTKWLELAYAYLQGEWNQYNSNEGPFDSNNEWRMRMPSLGQSIPQQFNGYDCGVLKLSLLHVHMYI
jgi:Ulp1 family protease